MKTWLGRLGWVALGVTGVAVAAALADSASGGSLDPPGPVGSTMKALGDLVPAWHQDLDSNGCGSARWTCVLGGQAVLDNETGVVWQRTPLYPSSSPLGWADARSSCESSNTGNRLGWRLPTSSELESLIDPNTGDLVAGNPFSGASPGAFWTSTTDVADSASAETVSFGGIFGWTHGSVLKSYISAAGAWCVRGQSGFDPAPPQDVSSWWRWNMPANDGFDSCHSSRFECTMGNAAVIDHMTGLVWTRSAAAAGSTSRPYGLAVLACGNLSIDGVTGWRLPASGELSSLLDTSIIHPDLSLPPGHPFQDVGPFPYWTSTDTTNGYKVAVLIDGGLFINIPLAGHGIELNTASDQTYVWCVRGPI